jgi:hypothetical protein
MTLHPEVEAAVRRLVLQTVQHHAAPRAELEALRNIVFARLCSLTAEDRQALESLLPALAVLRPATWCTSGEILALAAVAPGQAGVALRQAVQGHHGRAKAFGRLLTRCTGVPINGMYLLRVEPPHRRDSALYQVAGFPAP